MEVQVLRARLTESNFCLQGKGVNDGEGYALHRL